jgi:HKD family nuclease
MRLSKTTKNLIQKELKGKIKTLRSNKFVDIYLLKGKEEICFIYLRKTSKDDFSFKGLIYEHNHLFYELMLYPYKGKKGVLYMVGDTPYLKIL